MMSPPDLLRLLIIKKILRLQKNLKVLQKNLESVVYDGEQQTVSGEPM
jgi:hypothetical protein